ncbi:hypothetical protein [Absidia glauca]|uniref:Nuclear transport factor 2 n=1 Tax=Absidia glauca TaxID=4829 RepID=A0A168LVF8_ABSGL|nr:hypothetical protein [Absidia glauca]
MYFDHRYENRVPTAFSRNTNSPEFMPTGLYEPGVRQLHPWLLVPHCYDPWRCTTRRSSFMPTHHYSPPTTRYSSTYRPNPHQSTLPSITTTSSQYPTAYRSRSDVSRAWALPPVRHDSHLDTEQPFSTPISLDFPQQLIPLLKHYQVECSLLSRGWKVSGYKFKKKGLTSSPPPPAAPPSSPPKNIQASPFYVNPPQRDEPLNQRWEHIQSTVTHLAPMLDFATPEILLRTALQTPSSSASFRESSMLTFEGQQFQGANAITQKLVELPFQKVAHKISTIDAQPSTAAGSIIVIVSGQLLIDEEQNPQFFTQSFVLIPENNSFYVFNDMFRLIYGA